MAGQNYIAGQFCTANASLNVFNPSNGQILGASPASGQNEVDMAVDAARTAQRSWSSKTSLERAQFLKLIADRIRAASAEFAQVISQEQGKIMDLAEAEVEFAASYFEYTAEWARRIEGEIITSDNAREQILLNYKPIGVVAGILPWNFPFFLIARKTAPALLTGNAIVIKPSEETPLNALLFARLIDEIELPSGVFNLVSGKGSDVGSALSRHPDVGLVTFTGSVATGRAIMRDAAENITKVNLELGGKAPVIVLADADLALAADSIVASRIINSGQVCNCAERVYVEEQVYAPMLELLAQRMGAVEYGDPILARADASNIAMGPLINSAAVERVSAMVSQAVSAGARLLAGGMGDDSNGGSFFQPTLLADCTQDMRVMRDETFGPVLPVTQVTNLDEAISLSNDSKMGLTSSIFTNDLNSVSKAMRELQFGETYVNREHMEAFQGFHAGVRQSGIGGADGKHGLYEFMHTHVTYIQEH